MVSLSKIGHGTNRTQLQQEFSGRIARLMAVAVEVPSGLEVQKRTTPRIPALDGIRGLAVSLVLYWHVVVKPLLGNVPNHRILSGFMKFSRFTWTGVDLFFVLSGFLIGGILLDAWESPNYFKTFYVRRAYRILPLYSVVVACAFLFVFMRKTGHLAQLGFYPFFLQNFHMAATGSFGQVHLGLTWSLAVEEQFYLTLPWLIRFVTRKRLAMILFVAVFAAPVLRLLCFWKFSDNWVPTYVLLPCRADALCLGVLIALAVRQPERWKALTEGRYLCWILLASSGAAVLWLLRSPVAQYTSAFGGLEYSLFALFYALLLLSVLLSSWLSQIFSFGPLRFIGTIAYGAYLFQEILLLHRSMDLPHVLLFNLIGAVGIIGLAALSWKYFEKPLVKRGHRYAY